LKKIAIITIHALIGWSLCGAIIGIGFQFTTEQNTLIIHAIGAPIIFGLVTRNYFKRFAYTSPLHTAYLFLGITIAMDFFLVALVIQKSFVMFESILGTWIPFILIFSATILMGKYTKK